MPIIFWGIAAAFGLVGLGGGAALVETGQGAKEAASKTGDAIKLAAPILAIGAAIYISKRGFK